MRLEVLLVVRPCEVVVAGIARTELACAGRGSIPSLGIQGPSGIDRRRQPAADAIATNLAALARCVVAFVLVMVLNLPSLIGFARQVEGSAQRAIRHHGRRCREPAGDVRRSRCTGPAVATSGPRSPPRSAFAPSVAFGLGLRMLAAGPAHLLTVLRSRRLCERARELNKPRSWKLRRGGGTRRRCWTPAAGVA